MSPADISFSSRNMPATYAGRAGGLSASVAIPSSSVGANPFQSSAVLSQSYNAANSSAVLGQSYNTASGGMMGSRMAQTTGQLDMFGAIDRNHDGTISREEFAQAARSGRLGPIAVA